MLSRSTRILTPTRQNLAKLVSSSNTVPLNSVSPEWARTSPPTAPLPSRPPNRVQTQTQTTTRQPIPIPSTSTSDKVQQVVVVESRRKGDDDDDDDTRLEELFLRTLNGLDSIKGPNCTTSIPRLIESSRSRSGRVLKGFSLPYESTPSLERRVRIDGKEESNRKDQEEEEEEQDGIVLVAHVVGGREPKVVISSGFAIKAQQENSNDQGAMILTCSHTLAQVEGHLTKLETKSSHPSSPPSPPPPSASFVLTSSGHIFPIESLLSSLPSSDLLLLRLSPTPLDAYSPSSSHTLSSTRPPRLRSLPINPYPSPISTKISTHSYLNPLSRLSRKLSNLPLKEWQTGTIVEYKDSIGRTSQVGTYDELNSFWMSNLPLEGSSGGPIIEFETGSVVGITRGSTHKYGERTRYGFATPAERILDFFELPNFKTTAQRQRQFELEREKEEEDKKKKKEDSSRYKITTATSTSTTTSSEEEGRKEEGKQE